MSDDRVRMGGAILAAVLTLGFLVMGNVSSSHHAKALKPVSVLPEQPLDIPVMGRGQAQSGVDAILAWQQPVPAKPTASVKPGAVKATAAGKQVKVARR